MSGLNNRIQTSEQSSLWLQNKELHDFAPLKGDLSVDVAIVGGGIAGLTAGYIMQKSGMSVAVIEKNLIASGTTGGTTGKVTAQHGLIYKDIYSRFGRDTASIYAKVYTQAIDDTEQIIEKEHIDCGWSRQTNTVFTAKDSQIKKFREEADIAARLGLPASFEENLSLPFPVSAAVTFANQAQIDAAAYTESLATLISDNGGKVYENSQVTHFYDGKICKLSSPHGSVASKYVIVASKIPPFPLAARFSYGFLEYPETSYLVAGEYDGDLTGMHISPDRNHYSILPVVKNKRRYLLVGGRNHIPGLGMPKRRYKQLADYAYSNFDIKRIDYHWKAMDYISYDRLPLIGKLYPWSKNTYVISGFKKWGLSGAMVAAKVLRDIMQGNTSKAADIFYPYRQSIVTSFPKAVYDIVKLQFMNR